MQDNINKQKIAKIRCGKSLEMKGGVYQDIDI